MANETASRPPGPEIWFPYTKLQPPQPGRHTIPRDRLQQALADAAQGHRLTLIAAPAGSGKTILSATLTQGDAPTAWVSLDAADNDLTLFAALLTTALRPWLIDDGLALFTFLQNIPHVSDKPAPLAARLINSLRPLAHEPLALILDDYHVITDPAIHRWLAQLLDYLPDSLRLVIATRHDPPLPLPRLRARGQLAEIRLPSSINTTS